MRLPTEAGENTNQSSGGAQGQFLNIAPIAEKNSNGPIFAYKTGGGRRLFVRFGAMLLNGFDRICDAIGVFRYQSIIFAFHHHTN
ncbi:hypothetical protein E2L00_09010 [Cedecea colo]|uniref:Uncharacterized protein n=1 Tax=Cedecea colo TaxID=2552946 RepID=A0ABX0VKX1_9ENTR|nr:hypothetical protein [Cedecea colo]